MNMRLETGHINQECELIVFIQALHLKQKDKQTNMYTNKSYPFVILNVHTTTSGEVGINY